MRMLTTTAAICVSTVQEVTIVSVQMDSTCLKTTRVVNVQKVSRSQITGQCAWVSNSTNAVVGKKEENSQQFLCGLLVELIPPSSSSFRHIRELKNHDETHDDAV